VEGPLSRNVQFESKNRSFSRVEAVMVPSMKTSSISVTRSLPSTSANDDARWRAVLRRDRRADGKLFFGVATTGVYCRASCSARRPHRKHVTFFETAADVEKARFRACRRCHPNGPSLTQRQSALIVAACRRIETAEELPDLDTLAKTASLSRFHFHRLFKTATGMTPKAYALAYRSERMRAELEKRRTVTEAIYEVGFNSNGRFYANSSEILGMEAKIYRNGGTGATIRFAVRKCSLESILVAASDRGVCAIFLGDDPAALTKDLAKRFRRPASLSGIEISKISSPR
jgi:AraC family transcriptional regulator, regulatory protein of adaptative response / methylated-DNA-[protein]-cysteine methyltransferase